MCFSRSVDALTHKHHALVIDRNLAAQPVTRRCDTNTRQRGPEVIASSKAQRGLRARHQHTQELFMCVRDALCRWASQRSSSSQVEAPSAGFPLPLVLFIGEISPVYIPSLIPLNSDWLDLHFHGVVPVQHVRRLRKRATRRLFNRAGSQSTITSLTNTGPDSRPWAAAQFERSVQLTWQPPHSTALRSTFEMGFCKYVVFFSI